MAMPARGMCEGLFHDLQVSRSLVRNLELLAHHEECCVATSASSVISLKLCVSGGCAGVDFWTGFSVIF